MILITYYLWIKDEDLILEYKGVGQCWEKKVTIRVSQQTCVRLYMFTRNYQVILQAKRVR